MKKASEYRRLAKESLKGNWGGAIFVCVIVMLLTGAVNAIPVVGQVVAIVISGSLIVGEIMYFVELNRKHNPEVSILFKDFGKNLVGNLVTYLLMTIYTALWTLLLIVPGIIKTYSYSMSMFIRYKQPNIGGNEAISLSREIMNGRKMKLFKLHLSFIGWILLGIITFGIALLFVYPYMQAANVAFYEDAYNEYMCTENTSQTETEALPEIQG